MSMPGIITVFPKATDKYNAYYVKVDFMLERIKECKIKDKINALRNEQDAEKRRLAKAELPSICFSGKFKKRFDKELIEHSGFCILDFDHVADVEAKKREMHQYDFVYSAFVSPSGDGVKVLVKIPAEAERHTGHYLALKRKFPEMDKTSINVSRICFESIDSDIYINRDAVEFTEYIEEVKPIYTSTITPTSTTNTNYAKANIVAEMIRKAPDGEKHIFLLKASRLMGGYISGGLVTEADGIAILESEIQKRNIVSFEDAQKTIRAGITNGKSTPIKELERECLLLSKSTGILYVDSLWEIMKHDFFHGKKRGTTTHFKGLDVNFTWKEGEVTLMIGVPGSGKTEFMLQLMVLKSVFDKVKWGIFSPENFPPEDFYDGLIHTYIGKSTDPYYKSNQMTLDEYRKGYDFVREHFYYVYPEELHTMDEIDSNFQYLIEEKKIKGTLLDPFNQVVVDMGEKRDDQFLSTFLTERSRIAKKYELYSVITSHPKSIMRNVKTGEYPVIDFYDINMGAMWSNKVDNILSIHRPNFSSDPSDTSVELYIKKIKKHRLVGSRGMRKFNFERKTNRYYEDGNNPLGPQSAVPERISSPKEAPAAIQAMIDDLYNEKDPF